MLGLHKYGKVLFLTVLSINELWRNCLIWFLEGQCFQVWQAPYCFCGIYKCRKKMISLLTRVQSPYCPLRAMPYIFIFFGRGGRGRERECHKPSAQCPFPLAFSVEVSTLLSSDGCWHTLTCGACWSAGQADLQPTFCTRDISSSPLFLLSHPLYIKIKTSSVTVRLICVSLGRVA